MNRGPCGIYADCLIGQVRGCRRLVVHRFGGYSGGEI